jgi:hypothetical protein
VGVVRIPYLPSQVLVSTRRSDVRKALEAVKPGRARDPYDYNIGLAEAFDVERGFSDVLHKVIQRECDPHRSGVANPMECPGGVKAQIRQMQLQERYRSQRTFDALAVLGDALSPVDGPKTLVLVSGGMPMPDQRSAAAFDRLEASFAAAQVTLYTVFLERSSLFGQVQREPSPTALDDDRLEAEGIENATSSVGGTLMLAIGTLDQYFDRVVTEISGSYLLGVEVGAADRDGRPHRVEVKVNRPGVDVRARKHYVIATRAATAESGTARLNAPRTPRTTRPALPPPVTLEIMTPEVEAVVAKAGAYAAAYETDLSALVAEERYLQRAFRFERFTVTQTRQGSGGIRLATTEESGEWVPDGERVLKSDFLLVKGQGNDRWQPFRDVFEVDGRKVREREQRLQRLFLEAPAGAAERAAAISAESTRHNIGFVERNVNLPTLSLRLLDTSRRLDVVFRKVREAKVNGVTTWELAFAERGDGTLVPGLRATGTFWVDPAAGRVVRTTIRFETAGVATEMTVTYRPDARASSTWVPAEMRETYQSAARKLECLASYSNIRRFQVTTGEAQKD